MVSTKVVKPRVVLAVRLDETLASVVLGPPSDNYIIRNLLNALALAEFVEHGGKGVPIAESWSTVSN